MTAAATGWAQTRAWRDKNPLNLRPLKLPSKWRGQIEVDRKPGGPFVVFDKPESGWAAAYTNLMNYQTVHGINTIRGIVHRWAPSQDHNDELAYAHLVALLAGFDPEQTLDLHDWSTLFAIGGGMAIVEGGRLPWTLADQQAGLRLAGVKEPT